MANPPLHPQRTGRHSPIAAVALTSGEVDHLAGLFCLRESHPFTLLATASTLHDIDGSAAFGVLNPAFVQRQIMVPEQPIEIAGLTIVPFTVPGKVPLYREGDVVAIGAESEDVIGLEVTDGVHRLCYVPGVARLPASLVERLIDADLLLLDGTTFTDDELQRLALSAKTAGRMGHLPISGPAGSLHAFAGDGRARKVYIHLNNTNPVLIEDSPERALIHAAGWEVAHDGMDIAL